MALVVQKFGGTSVADIDKIKNVAAKAIREKKAGNEVVVVLSAWPVKRIVSLLWLIRLRNRPMKENRLINFHR